MRHVPRMGIDVAKPVFQVHGVDERGHTVRRRRLARSQGRAVLPPLPPCVGGAGGLRPCPRQGAGAAGPGA